MRPCSLRAPARKNRAPRSCGFLGRLFSLLLAAKVLCTLPSSATAHPSSATAQVALSEERPADGRPTVVLDRLEFPKDVLGAASFEARLRKTLKTEAAKADWGAGRENRIEYRFSVTELKYTLVDGALRAHCSAIGKLPRGQTAKSELTFSGHPSERVTLTHKVLEIVARGVITRLAEVERRRRGLR